MATINRGSEWRKWDLHVHTPATLCSDYGGDTDVIWQKYFEELERLAVEKNIKVIGINDYLFIDGYKKVLEYKKNGGLSSVELILPVVEFRLREFVGSKELGRLNYHVIFADDSLLTIDQIETHFLSNLKGKGNLEATCPDGFTWGGVITRETLIDLGNHIIENTPVDKRTNVSPIEVGFNNLNFELSKIQEILGEGSEPNTFLKDKYFKAIGKAEWEDFRWDTSALEKKSIINGAHFVFSASPTFEQANKGKETLEKQGVSSRLMHCSDSHGFAKDINHTNSKELGHCFTWIKANPTFEGLKQIIYEPEERVKIQKEQPESEKLDHLMIEKITFTSSNLRFTREPIYFNKNLNVIIGGKSSGKSILLYEIAKTLYSNVSDKVLKYTDIEDYKEKDLYDLSFISKDVIDADYNFTIELFSRSSQTLKDRVVNSSILPSIKYIPQNHLANLVDKSRKNGATLKKLIRDLILEDPEYKTKYDDFVAHAQRNDEKRSQDIDYYFNLKNELKKKEDDLLTKGDTKALKEGVEFNKQKITQLNKDFTPEEQSQYKELNEKLSSLNIKENEINTDFEKLDIFRADIARFLIEFASKKKIVLDSLQNENIKNEYSSKLQFVDDALISINEITRQLQKDENNKFIEDSTFAKETILINVAKENVDNGLKVFNNKLEDQKQVAALQKSIAEDESKLAAIEQFLKEIETTKIAIVAQREKIFSDFATNLKLYESIIENLKPRISNIQNETDKIEILPVIKYNFPKFRELADEVFNGRSFNNQGFGYLYQYANDNPKSALAEVDFTEIEKALRVMFEKIENNQLVTKGGNSQKDACEKIFTDFFFDHWDVKSQGDDIHKMSTGKASFVLLKLIIKLSKEDGPILIDQPEDNLDNRSVSHELVEFLKEKKRERQIILVTHNPNIVVNADAENIIVANQKGQNDTAEKESTSDYHFDYINGALEDSFPKNGKTDLLKSMGIREHIAEIVEGGKEAFKKREKKYGF
ncbi:hypothetical protein D0809_10370 [Flavobacterium circumlabens]|uniref:ATPase AAA-type core domain-containing protein n=1 Tax=Flavobacterium circumlabens TaxID=2133765 RepID=A0A4Y7UD71_9FLAO|nr:hypothetical protein [Flavobacterium circumlabens]TCN58745.1 hypothetical protein EV142_103185 [Flavobacterium circumlabens]TEB44161.1 hypothetical protein D0809_10370 [Flavobacterium circumlabens]